MSQIIKNSSGGGGGAIITIDGDVGSITGSTVTIFANNSSNGAGATVLFNNSGTTSTLLLSDSLSNLSLGQGANANSSTASNCTAVGVDALTSINLSSFNSAFGNGALSNFQGNNLSGGNNCAFGAACLDNLIDGNQNCAIGSSCGVNYTGSESANILIESDGVTGESHVIRIGRQGSGSGQQNECFIAGIVGNTVSNSEFVTVNSSTGQLGVYTPTIFSVKLSTNQSGVTGDGTQYQIPFDTIVVDTASGYSASTHLYTFPSTGQYQINITDFVFTSSGTATSGSILGYLFVNGSTNIRLIDNNPLNLGLTANGEFMASASMVYNATAGDTMGVYVQLSGGTKNIGVAGGAESCLFSGFKIN